MAQFEKDVNIIFILEKLAMICIIPVKKNSAGPIDPGDAQPGGMFRRN